MPFRETPLRVDSLPGRLVAAWYTLELMPVLYERFHDWHRRMGMERSPLDHVGCC